MMELACGCGAVRLSVQRSPDFLQECNCMLCRKAGAWWAYYHPDEMRVDGATTRWQRPDRAEPAVDVHACARCGATTHFTLTPAAISRHGNVQLGVNMKLAGAADLTGTELRFPDGAGWDGQGAFGYVADPRIL